MNKKNAVNNDVEKWTQFLFSNRQEIQENLSIFRARTSCVNHAYTGRFLFLASVLCACHFRRGRMPLWYALLTAAGAFDTRSFL